VRRALFHRDGEQANEQANAEHDAYDDDLRAC